MTVQKQNGTHQTMNAIVKNQKPTSKPEVFPLRPLPSPIFKL